MCRTASPGVRRLEVRPSHVQRVPAYLFPRTGTSVRDFHAPKPSRYAGRNLRRPPPADFRCGPPCPSLCEGATSCIGRERRFSYPLSVAMQAAENAVRIFLQDSGKHPDIQIDSLADFAQTDEFVRTVRPCAVAYAQLQRRDVEQGLVRCRGRSVGRAAQRQSGRTIGWAGGMLDGLSRVERGTTSLRTWRRISSSTSSFV